MPLPCIKCSIFDLICWIDRLTSKEAGVIEEVEVAPPQTNEVRVKILFTSLCHTDVYFWEARGRHHCFLAYLVTKLEGLGATLNVAKPKKGQSVAVFGMGAVGLAAAEGARMAGASRIIGVDLNPSRFEEAKKFGVTEFVNPKDHDKPVQEGWGVAVLVGVPSKDDAFKTHPINLLNERTLKGTFFGNYKPRSDIPDVVEKYMNKELELDKFITHSVPFSEINKAFDYMLHGKAIRCIMTMGG
ncbi:Alcohol dehydrogenase class-P [Morella rubra]|uniref:Alcohol dehydrogenase class-P n=1 Tax=Morella rubra TaxID=262757 RepID=A0A6A1W6L5_9ROSI|nr:Alcohol dehydrogenase class-P [Morella rubra]